MIFGIIPGYYPAVDVDCAAADLHCLPGHSDDSLYQLFFSVCGIWKYHDFKALRVPEPVSQLVNQYAVHMVERRLHGMAGNPGPLPYKGNDKKGDKNCYKNS